MLKIKRIVFDIETKPFSNTFRNAKTNAAKLRSAPRMRLACVFDEQLNTHSFFFPKNVREFITKLKKADEVISYNGKGFDKFVLMKHYGLTGNIPQKGQHIDMLGNIKKLCGFRVSLDKMAKLNLGKGKHTKGREMENLNVEDLKMACKSDVDQTYEIWKLYKKNKLKYPEKIEREDYLEIDEFGPPHPILESAELLGLYDPEQMGDLSDANESEYMALLESGGDPSWAMDQFGIIENLRSKRKSSKVKKVNAHKSNKRT